MDISHTPLQARDSSPKARTVRAAKIHDLAGPGGHRMNIWQKIEYACMTGPAIQSHHCIPSTVTVDVHAHLWKHRCLTRIPTARTTPGNRTVAAPLRAVIREYTRLLNCLA